MMHHPRLAVTILALAHLLAGCGRGPAKSAAAPAVQKQPVEVTPVVRRDLTEALNLVGTIAANESATIRPEITGLVRGIYFEEGQHVTKGQLLMRIEDSELRAQLSQSEARFQLAELNLQRAEKLRETRSNTEADVDRARSEFASARSDLELIRVRLDRAEVKAPFEGVVGARTLSPGDYVNPQASLTTIDDLSRLKIEFQVPERFLAKVKPGTAFAVNLRSEETAKGAPARVAGTVYFVSAVIDRSTRSSQVKGYLSERLPQLRPGMFANVELVLAVIPGALTVPEGAVLATPAGARLVVVRERDGTKVADFVPVVLGLRAKGLVEVAPAAAGKLADGDQVVASGVGALILFPGSVLDPRPARAQFKSDLP